MVSVVVGRWSRGRAAPSLSGAHDGCGQLIWPASALLFLPPRWLRPSWSLLLLRLLVFALLAAAASSAGSLIKRCWFGGLSSALADVFWQGREL